MSLNAWSEHILIAELLDEPSLSDDLDALMRRLEESEASLNVILDMRSVTYLNSSNLAQLLKVRKRVSDRGGRLRICCVSDPVWSVLLITGLDALFEFTDDVSTSIASLQIDS